MKTRLHGATESFYGKRAGRAIVGYANDVSIIFSVQEIHLIPSLAMYQHMEGFSALCQADQRLQIKTTMHDLFMFSVIMYFNIEKDSMLMALDRVSIAFVGLCLRITF